MVVHPNTIRNHCNHMPPKILTSWCYCSLMGQVIPDGRTDGTDSFRSSLMCMYTIFLGTCVPILRLIIVVPC